MRKFKWRSGLRNHMRWHRADELEDEDDGTMMMQAKEDVGTGGGTVSDCSSSTKDDGGAFSPRTPLSTVRGKSERSLSPVTPVLKHQVADAEPQPSMLLEPTVQQVQQHVSVYREVDESLSPMMEPMQHVRVFRPDDESLSPITPFNITRDQDFSLQIDDQQRDLAKRDEAYTNLDLCDPVVPDRQPETGLWELNQKMEQLESLYYLISRR